MWKKSSQGKEDGNHCDKKKRSAYHVRLSSTWIILFPLYRSHPLHLESYLSIFLIEAIMQKRHSVEIDIPDS